MLTKEMQNERKCGMQLLENEIPFLGEPTYFFNIGDEVSFGAMLSATVKEVLFDGKIYGMLCTYKIERTSEIAECYRVAAWHDVRPLTNGTTDFTKNEDIKLYFNNSTIESLLNKHFHFGVDFTPDYQRDYVWTDEDKERLLDSVFSNIEIGKFVFIPRDEGDYSYEILDGKQRLSTLIDFYQNRFPYKGYYYNDLSPKDKRTFDNHSVVTCDAHITDEQTKN